MKIDWDNIPTINAKRVSLRPFNANDADAVYQIYANPEVMRYWGGSPMVDLHEANDFLAGAQEDLRRRQCIQWGIAHRPDNQIIGTIVFFRLDAFAHKAEIGFALGRHSWGMGYMHEALQAALGYGFDELEFRRIEADVDPRNLRSLRLLEGVGFKNEGYLRERWFVAGKTQDSLFYGLLKKEWNCSGASYEVIVASRYAATSVRARIVNSRLGHWTAVALGLLH
jgi:RimJ/RimL family protein N-acetyltransferase